MLSASISLILFMYIFLNWLAEVLTLSGSQLILYNKAKSVISCFKSHVKIVVMTQQHKLSNQKIDFADSKHIEHVKHYHETLNKILKYKTIS